MGLLLLVSSAFLHALWNSWVKGEKNKEAFLTIVICCATGMAWLGLLIQPAVLGTRYALNVALLSGVFEGLYFAALAYTLGQASLSWAYALMRGGAMILVWVGAVSLLGEKVSQAGIFGAALIFTALWIPVFGPGQARQSRKAILSALFCAVCIAGYHISYDEALRSGISPALLFAIALSVSAPFSLINVYVRGQQREMFAMLKKRPFLIAFAGLIVYSSFILYLMGLQKTAPGFAISLRNTSIFFALLLGTFLGEKITRIQLITCAMIFMGAILLGWGR